MINLTALYPKTDTSRFDRDYYLNRHIPLVKERLTPMGLTSVDIQEGLAGAAPDMPPAYAVIARLNFSTLDELQAGLGTHGPELIGDIPNFTDVPPIMQISRVL